MLKDKGFVKNIKKKINKLTIIVLESADPYLPDRVEFKHTSFFL